MDGKTYTIEDTGGDKIEVQGRSIAGVTLVDLLCDEKWNELTKKQAFELIEAIQNAIKEVD